MGTIKTNSDILVIYDAKLCNPNGDPDNENKPRIDVISGRNIVTDVRFKRYIRNYLKAKGEKIFIEHVEGSPVNATEKLKIDFNTDKPGELKEEDILSKYIDVRLFGATMPIKRKDKAGTSITFTGPVQFTWGYSFNKVSLVDSSTITSHFRSETEKEQGAMGKDYRLYYSLIGFYGIISAIRARYTQLTEEDINKLDDAIVNSLKLEATTRSKIGQTLRLYIRIEYKDEFTFAGDLREKIKLIKDNEKLRDVSEVKLDAKELTDLINNLREKINRIKFYQSPDISIENLNLPEDIKEEIRG